MHTSQTNRSFLQMYYTKSLLQKNNVKIAKQKKKRLENQRIKIYHKKQTLQH